MITPWAIIQWCVAILILIGTLFVVGTVGGTVLTFFSLLFGGKEKKK